MNGSSGAGAGSASSPVFSASDSYSEDSPLAASGPSAPEELCCWPEGYGEGYVAARHEHAAGQKDMEWNVAVKQAVVAAVTVIGALPRLVRTVPQRVQSKLDRITVTGRAKDSQQRSRSTALDYTWCCKSLYFGWRDINED